MAQGNVPISLLLDSNGKEQNERDKSERSTSTPASGSQVQNLVSQFQTTLDASGQSSQSPTSSLPLDLTSKATPRAIAPARRGRPPTNPQSGQLLDQLKSFQTNFRAAAKKATTQQKIIFKPPKTSRASITAIINVDDANGDPAAATPPPPEKKRRGPKTDGLSKRAKSETTKKPTKAELKAAELKGTELKKTSSKNKTPELSTSIIEKPGIHATMTAEKKKWGQGTPSVADPSILEAGEGGMRMMGREEDTKDGSETSLPVIVLDIPLLDPKNPRPGQAEVVVHVMKMAEEKYGWNAVHPNSKSAIDLLDEMLEDEDDGEEDEEEETIVVDKGATTKKKDDITKDKDNSKDSSKDKDKEKKKKKGPKVNRKVGKYDCDDPFIDDTELQWEEEITTTKEGYFVYWGPLVDDRSSGQPRKIAAKNKK